jgi:hypothetical protein
MGEMLSEHFSVAEFIYSDTAKARKIANIMTDSETARAKHTAVYLLENIRKQLNLKYASDTVKCVTIKITSGFRGSALNKAVGGATNSQHCKAEAADIEATIVYTNGTRKVIPYTQLYNDIKELTKNKKLYIDQCIQEASGDAYWVHVSLCAEISKARYQFLKYNNGKYTLDCTLK